MTLEKLYQAYSRLNTDFGWKRELVFSHGKDQLPVHAYLTQKTGPALWVFGGIHGDEKAGPNAFALEITTIAKMAKICPMVLIPLCNPLGFIHNRRYPHPSKSIHVGKSVGDSETTKGKLLVKYLIMTSQSRPPRVLLDHHEDHLLPKSYIYSHGPEGVNDPIAKQVLEIIALAAPIQRTGMTRWNEPVINGIVTGHDGSIDDFVTKPPISAHTSIVIETPGIDAHVAVIRAYSAIAQAALG